MILLSAKVGIITGSLLIEATTYAIFVDVCELLRG